MAPDLQFPLFYRWKLAVLWGPKGSPLYKMRCRLIASGRLNSQLVEFEDGTRFVVSRNALAPWKAELQFSLFDS